MRPLVGANVRFLRLFHNASVKQMNGALREVRISLVVRNHADRGAAGVQLLEQRHDGFAVARIKIAGWLIGEKNCRLAC